MVGTALILLSAAALAGRSSRGAFLRLRIISAVTTVTTVTTVAIVVIVALPGTLPAGLKAEQAFAGAIMLGLVLLANGGRARARFAERSPR